jgi:hypothetical protein
MYRKPQVECLNARLTTFIAIENLLQKLGNGWNFKYDEKRFE